MPNRWDELQKKNQVNIPGVTEKIDTRQIEKIQKGTDWQEKIAKLRALKKAAGKGAKFLGALAGPAIGVASALSSGDVSAATPMGASTDAAARPGSLSRKLEDGTISPEEIKQYYAEKEQEEPSELMKQARLNALKEMRRK